MHGNFFVNVAVRARLKCWNESTGLKRWREPSAASNWRQNPNCGGRTRDGIAEESCGINGGPGSEREVSLATGKGVSKALRSLGLKVTDVDVRNENFEIPDGTELAFIAIHGTFGEDGQVQRILEERGVAYTGEGAAESETAFNKISTKERLERDSVPTPELEVIRQGDRPRMSLPFVLKAPRQGSTVGVYIIKDADEIGPSLEDAALMIVSFWWRNSFRVAS